MANLIIKPSTGGDLVIKGSDDSPAITVGTTGQTTFAEPATMSGTLGVTGNTTLSGSANNLGTVTAGSIAGGSITSATTFPADHVIKISELFGVASDLSVTNSLAVTNFWNTAGVKYTPDGGSSNNSTIHCFLHVRGWFKQQANADGRGYGQYKIEGDDITNVHVGAEYVGGVYDYGASGTWNPVNYFLALPPVTLDGTGNGQISFEFYHNSSGPAHSDQQFGIYGNGTAGETYLKVIEVQ